MLNTEPEGSLRRTQNLDKVIHVCVAVIERQIDPDREIDVLIAKRPDHVHQGGLWEFPGGKVEAGESLLKALDRELNEELGIQLRLGQEECSVDFEDVSPLIQIRHAYPDKTVLLDVWKVRQFEGQAYGKEGQKVCWVPLSQLSEYHFPQANLPIIRACLLPNRYFITPSYPSLLAAKQDLQRALEAGAQLIYFRQPQLDAENYASWISSLQTRLPGLQQVLMHQCTQTLSVDNGAGVHLSFQAASQLSARPVHEGKWFAVSCHSELELAHATHLKADFVTLSPVLETSSHPGQKGIGWQVFRQWIGNATQPVYGLGGLSEEHERELALSGAQGLAGISFWQ